MKKIITFGLIMTITCLLTGCFKDKKAQEYSDYLKSAMDTSYVGDYNKYLELAKTTKEEAEELYSNTIQYLAYSLMNYNDVNYEALSDEAIEKYNELAKKALTKVKYTVNEAKKIDGIYQIKVEITPLDIWEITNDEVDEYIEEFINKYPNYESMSDEELLDVEEEYAENILAILTKYVDDIKYKDSISKIVEIQFDDEGLYGISDEEWNDIDDYVMGIK